VRIWDTESAECLDTLQGHRSRIWDVSCSSQGDFLASASGDSTVKVKTGFYFDSKKKKE
jgi:WD40 repeat protein